MAIPADTTGNSHSDFFDEILFQLSAKTENSQKSSSSAARTHVRFSAVSKTPPYAVILLPSFQMGRAPPCSLNPRARPTRPGPKVDGTVSLGLNTLKLPLPDSPWHMLLNDAVPSDPLYKHDDVRNLVHLTHELHMASPCGSSRTDIECHRSAKERARIPSSRPRFVAPHTTSST